MSFKLTTPKALTILATLISCLQTSADSTAKDVCLNFTTGEKIYFSFDSHPVLTIIDSEIKISSAKNEIFIYSIENLHKITFENDSGISDYPLPGDDNGTISREDSEFIAFNGFKPGTTVDIVSASGVSMFRGHISDDNTFKISLRNFNPGIYIIRAGSKSCKMTIARK